MAKANTAGGPPLYALYGEMGLDSSLDGLHLESIADRSRLHNWEIRPHRHSGFVQLLLVERGSAHVDMDGHGLVLRGPAVIWVPPLAVHGFAFTPDTRGHVITLDQGALRKLLGPARGLWEELGHARALRLPARSPVFRALHAVVGVLQAEYASVQAWRSLALDGAVQMLASTVARLPRLFEPADAGPVAGEGRSMLHLARYREQVERRFRSHPTLAALCEPLGITPTQLNRLCRRHLHCSALEVLHQRLLLEAKRELGYTSLQVRQISDGLGFSDPAYFTRFFQRMAQASPSAWRERQQAP
jgi:AraC family transcriptional activator of pobA